jgi:dienelactone hydrolase
MIERLSATLLVALLLVVSGCRADTDASVTAVVRVTPTASSFDAPVHVRVSGLPKRSLAWVSLHAPDYLGVIWSSKAEFQADALGVIDVDHSAPLRGSYSGQDGMGLIWSMQPPSGEKSARTFSFGPSASFSLRVHVADKIVGTAAFTRTLREQPLSRTNLTRAEDGLVGEFTFPDDSGRGKPGVLLIGGSEGGVPGTLTAVALANHGYAVLGLAYFQGPDLPERISRIPLEYFAKALRWMAARPEVDPQRIVVLGFSRGSEAGLDVAALFPTLVHAVVVGSPSNVNHCSYPGCRGAAWTFRGRDLPYTSEAEPGRAEEAAAAIAVENIRGPILLACGGQDRNWPSCHYADAIVERRREHANASSDQLAAYPLAGHEIGSFLPYLPVADHTRASFDADQQALGALWPVLLEFLRKNTA